MKIAAPQQNLIPVARPSAPKAAITAQSGPGDRFVLVADHVSNQLLKLEGRLTGTVMALKGADVVTNLATGGHPLVFSMDGVASASLGTHGQALAHHVGGLAGTAGIVAMVALGAGIAYAGWKAGGYATDKALEGYEKLADKHVNSAALQALPKAALAIAGATPLVLGFNNFDISGGYIAAGMIATSGALATIPPRRSAE